MKHPSEEYATSSPPYWTNGHSHPLAEQLRSERRITLLEARHDALRERVALLEETEEWVRATAWGLFWRLVRGAFFLAIGLIADFELGSGAVLKAIRSHTGL